MPHNVPIPELTYEEDVSLMLAISSARQRRTQQGKLFIDAVGRNHTGSIPLRIRDEVLNVHGTLKTGLWEITGRLETNQDRQQLIVARCQPVTLARYREEVEQEPVLPRAFTLDIETLTLPDFRERVGAQLERQMRLGNMRWEQQQRYLEDIVAEEERCYQLGSLSAASGRVLSIAVHVGALAGLEIEGVEPPSAEYVFGIDPDGTERDEKETLSKFLKLLNDFDPDIDELVGHNISAFDLPFIFQRCLVNCIRTRVFVNPTDYNGRGIFDTMSQWWLGDRRGRISLDDLAWALGIESSKTSEVEGSKVFELYQQGRLAEIREYNLRDVRVTRQVYERIVSCLGRDATAKRW